MAQTKRKRQTKHRGNAAGVVESRGRTGRKPTTAEKSGDPRALAREKQQAIDRRDRPPTWRGAFVRAMVAAVLMLFVLLIFCSASPTRRSRCSRSCCSSTSPISFYTDQWMYDRRHAQEIGAGRWAEGGGAVSGLDVRCLHSRPGAGELLHRSRGRGTPPRAVIVDPGDEPERLLAAVSDLGVEIEAILLTHCHFDHIGAVAPIARATGAPGLLPGDRASAARRHHALGAAGLRSVREPTSPSTPSAAASG